MTAKKKDREPEEPEELIAPNVRAAKTLIAEARAPLAALLGAFEQIEAGLDECAGLDAHLARLRADRERLALDVTALEEDHAAKRTMFEAEETERTQRLHAETVAHGEKLQAHLDKVTGDLERKQQAVERTITQEREQHAQRIHDAEQRVEQLRAEIVDLSAKRAEEEMTVEELRATAAHLRDEIGETQQRVNRLARRSGAPEA